MLFNFFYYIYSIMAIITIIKTPALSATISFNDWKNPLLSFISGIIETVAMYIKPPAVNGNMHDVANPLMALSNIKLKRVPLRAPNAVNNCRNIAYYFK